MISTNQHIKPSRNAHFAPGISRQSGENNYVRSELRNYVTVDPSAVDTKRTASIHRNVTINSSRSSNNTLPRSAYYNNREKITTNRAPDKVEIRLRSFSQNGLVTNGPGEADTPRHIPPFPSSVSSSPTSETPA